MGLTYSLNEKKTIFNLFWQIHLNCWSYPLKILFHNIYAFVISVEPKSIEGLLKLLKVLGSFIKALASNELFLNKSQYIVIEFRNVGMNYFVVSKHQSKILLSYKMVSAEIVSLILGLEIVCDILSICKIIYAS